MPHPDKIPDLKNARMDATADFPALKDPLGHTRQMSVRDYGSRCIIAHECSCGSVFARGEFERDDMPARMAVFGEGRDRGHRHIAETLAALALGGQS